MSGLSVRRRNRTVPGAMLAWVPGTSVSEDNVKAQHTSSGCGASARRMLRRSVRVLTETRTGSWMPRFISVTIWRRLMRLTVERQWDGKISQARNAPDPAEWVGCSQSSSLLRAATDMEKVGHKFAPGPAFQLFCKISRFCTWYYTFRNVDIALPIIYF